MDKNYVVEALERAGSLCPAHYIQMLADTPADKMIEGMGPWIFEPMPDKAIEIFRDVLSDGEFPFAQALGIDMVACFRAKRGASPTVIVINPWSNGFEPLILAELADYEEWLRYAKTVSSE